MALLIPIKMVSEKDMLELREALTQIESLLILQLLRGGATTEQIETVLKIKNIFPSNIKTAFPVKKLKKRGNNENE